MRYLALLLAAVSALDHVQAAAKPPFRYVEATAYHVLPGTHNQESGYFSLCEGRDGRVYIGTAKYGENAYLVEFDPTWGRQRIVVDAHKACGLKAKGYAAQAKFHTRNYVGRSGKIYVGTKQGYAEKGDKSKYPGGYLITFDPRSGVVENLGIPFPEQGIIDVVADEARKVVYVVTCEKQHWMRYDMATRKYRELGPLLTSYATTLVDKSGGASVLTDKFELATYNPKTEKITIRPIKIGDKTFTRAGGASIPTWNLGPDGRTAYLILMNDPTLLTIDLMSKGGAAQAVDCGKVIKGSKPDSRSALTIGPDGQVYTIVGVDNETGFGKGRLHHLLRYDPKKKKHEDLGVLAVKNPDFFNFKNGPDGKKPPWSHGFHTLPDGRMVPLHHHMALVAGRDGTLYATIIYPFTLLKIDGFKLPPVKPSPASAFLQELEKKIDAVEAKVPQITKVAETCAERYRKGGLIGVPWIGATLEQELYGRSGGVIHFGFERPPHASKERKPAEVKQDMVIFSWDEKPRGDEAKRIANYKAKGVLVLGFGAKSHPEVAKMAALCDVWFDTGGGANDRLITWKNQRLGKSNHIVNALLGWCFIAEFVSAHTRGGKMPTMWKSWESADGKSWSERYFRKKRFHDDYRVPPIPRGELAAKYLAQMRSHLRAFSRTQLPRVRQTAETIAAEVSKGQTIVVASSGHMAMNFIAKYDDRRWAKNIEVHHNVDHQLKQYREKAPQGGLTLRLGYMGLHEKVQKLFKEKKSRVLLIAAEHPSPTFSYQAAYPEAIDMGFAFGDASVSIEGYPIRLFPASGVMQATAYECVNVEVLSRVGGKRP